MYNVLRSLIVWLNDTTSPIVPHECGGGECPALVITYWLWSASSPGSGPGRWRWGPAGPGPGTACRASCCNTATMLQCYNYPDSQIASVTMDSGKFLSTPLIWWMARASGPILFKFEIKFQSQFPSESEDVTSEQHISNDNSNSNPGVMGRLLM